MCVTHRKHNRMVSASWRQPGWSWIQVDGQRLTPDHQWLYVRWSWHWIHKGSKLSQFDRYWAKVWCVTNIHYTYSNTSSQCCTRSHVITSFDQNSDNSLLSISLKFCLEFLILNFFLALPVVRYFRKGNYFGLACFANMPVESELERGARMKSVGILSPSYTLLYRYMHFLENQVR